MQEFLLIIMLILGILAIICFYGFVKSVLEYADQQNKKFRNNRKYQ